MSLSKPNLLLAVFAVVRASACLNATLEEAGSSNRYAEFVADGESAVLSCGYRFTSDSLVPYLSDSATRNCTSFQSSVYCGAPDALPTVHYANWFFQNQTDKQERALRAAIRDAELSDSNLVLRLPQVNSSLYGVYTCAVYVRANASSYRPEAGAAADGSAPCECYIMRKGLNLFGRVRGSEELARDAIVRLIAALISSGVFIALASGACLVYTFRYKSPTTPDVSDELRPSGEKNVGYELDPPPLDEELQETSDCDGREKPATGAPPNDKETAM